MTGRRVAEPRQSVHMTRARPLVSRAIWRSSYSSEELRAKVEFLTNQLIGRDRLLQKEKDEFVTSISQSNFKLRVENENLKKSLCEMDDLKRKFVEMHEELEKTKLESRAHLGVWG